MDVLSQGLGSAWSLVASFIPKLIGFLIILLIGWLIAKAVSKAVELLLTKTGFPKLIEKTGLGHLAANFSISGLIVKLVYYFILLIALQYAFAAFGSGNPVSELLNQIVSYLPRVIVAVILVIIAAAIARVVRDLLTNAMQGRGFAKLLGTIIYAFIIALGVIAALNQLGIATTVTLPVLITALGTLGGVLIVGVGGGLIRPMQSRWEGWLTQMQSEFRTGGATGQAPTAGAGSTTQRPTSDWPARDEPGGGEHRL